ncbi:hypothetical protein CCMA1212_001474, partial [Trichoderma ghanense]
MTASVWRFPRHGSCQAAVGPAYSQPLLFSSTLAFQPHRRPVLGPARSSPATEHVPASTVEMHRPYQLPHNV